jgi:hypothetical protein
MRLPDQPRHKTCGIVGDTTAFFNVGIRGRILSVVQNVARESISEGEIARRRETLIQQLGAPSYEGDDTHGNIVHYWHTDTLCASIYEVERPVWVQVSYNTPDFFGRCMS